MSELPIDYDRMADVYDACVLFDEDIPFLLEECAGASGPVLELMAGTGRVTVPLAEAGVDLTCVDASEEMLAVLREKLAGHGLTATILLGDVRDLDLPEASFPMAILPFHAFAELVEEEDQRRALASIHRCPRRALPVHASQPNDPAPIAQRRGQGAGPVAA